MRLNIFSFVKKHIAAILFVVIALTMGGIIIKTTSPLAGGDYDSHYYTAYALATGQGFYEKSSSQSYRGITQQSLAEKMVYKSTNVMQVRNDFMLGGGCSSYAEDASRLILASFTRDPSLSRSCVANGSKDGYTRVEFRQQYPQINYIPEALGLYIGMAMNKPAATAQQFARLSNLLVYILLFVLVIEMMPTKKTKIGMALIGSLPPSVSTASSFAVDAICIALCALFIGYILKLYMENKMLENKQVIFLAVMGVALFIAKLAYAPLFLLIFALSDKALCAKKKVILFASTCLTGVGIYLLWSHFYGSTIWIVSALNNVSIVQHDLIPAGLLTVASAVFGPLQIISHSTYLVLPNDLYVFVIVVMMIWLSRQKLPRVSGVKDFFKKYRLAILAIISWVACLSMTYFALLLSWTNILAHGFTEIDGFNPRYLLPLLPLWLTILCLPVKKDAKSSQKDSNIK